MAWSFYESGIGRRDILCIAVRRCSVVSWPHCWAVPSPHGHRQYREACRRWTAPPFELSPTIIICSQPKRQAR